MTLLNTFEYASQLTMVQCLVTSARWKTGAERLQTEESLGVSGWLQAAPVRKKTGGEGDICIHCTTEKMWEEEERQPPMGGFPWGRQHLNNKDGVRQLSRKE